MKEELNEELKHTENEELVEDQENDSSNEKEAGLEESVASDVESKITRPKSDIKADVMEQIKTIYDPEIPVNIFELGLIYEVTIHENRHAHVLMTLTAPACPAAEMLPAEVKQKSLTVDNVDTVEVELTFEPPWDQEMMSDEARLELGFM